MNIKNKIQVNAPMKGEAIIKNMIDADLKSAKKIMMSLSEDYYAVKNTEILKKKITYYTGNPPVKTIDPDAINNKIPSGYNKELVDQAVNFSLSQDITLSAEESESDMLIEIKNKIVKRKFKKILKQLYKESRKKGLSWCYYFINEKGDFDYMFIDAMNIIPIYDQTFENKLLQIIRYYPIMSVDNQGNEVQIYKVEVYDSEKITYYIQDATTKEYSLSYNAIDPTIQANPVSYLNLTTSVGGEETVEPLSWGRVPFIKLKCNEEETPDLQLTKQYIDAYDRLVSETQDELDGMVDKFIAIKGYSGDAKTGANLMHNLKKLKFAPVAENGSVDIVSETFDFEGKIAILTIHRQNIYRFGMGVDMNIESSGAISGVALDRQFYNLKMKADDGEAEISDFVREFYSAVNHYIENVAPLDGNLKSKYSNLKPIDAENIDVNFNRAMITDLESVVKLLKESKGSVSDKTLWENHPFVEDPAIELERMEEEKKKEMEEFDVPKIPDDAEE